MHSITQIPNNLNVCNFHVFACCRNVVGMRMIQTEDEEEEEEEEQEEKEE
jgi:hypothetical protein